MWEFTQLIVYLRPYIAFEIEHSTTLSAVRISGVLSESTLFFFEHMYNVLFYIGDKWHLKTSDFFYLTRLLINNLSSGVKYRPMKGLYTNWVITCTQNFTEIF